MSPISTFFLVGLVLSLGVLAWVSVHYMTLRRQLRDYQKTLRKVTGGSLTLLGLPANVRGLESISNSFKALVTSLSEQLSGVEANRTRLAAVLDQMTDAVLIASAEGRIQFANPAAEGIFGVNLIDRTVAETLRNHQLVQAWQRCHETGKMQAEAVEVPGRRHFLQLIVIPDQYVPGGTLLVVQDLTRIRKLETIRRDFISNISHELRTPLASLKALTETLQDGALSDPEAAPRFIGRIATEVDALAQMAQELLDLSRIESGQVELQRHPVSPEVILTSAADRMRMQADRAGLSLSVECPSDLPDVDVDSPRIEQVLVNLIHNAVKFTPPGGDVILRAERVSQTDPPADIANAESLIRFAVSDSGAGIPEDDLPRIFERFYRVDKSRSGGGTGLGLSISRHLIEAHGGKIWVKSIQGEGSTFYFTV